MNTKPLWQQFYEMTEAEAAAEMAEDRRRLESGEMTEFEASQRMDAWRRCAKQQLREAEALHRHGRARWPNSRTILDAGLAAHVTCNHVAIAASRWRGGVICSDRSTESGR
jgi:hypothetical protein